MSRDLLSAWWLPVALLLPPVYALLAPIVLQTLLQLRVRAAVLHRRVFSAAAIGLAGCAASLLFHGLAPEAWPLSGSDSATIMLAILAAVVFALINTALIAIAAHTANPDLGWRAVLWDRESFTLDVVELCLGVTVTVGCGLHPILLLLALPRSCCSSAASCTPSCRRRPAPTRRPACSTPPPGSGRPTPRSSARAVRERRSRS
ncbi:hypothetical protein ACFSTC_10925 [Nonomuraea ferruginea]